MRSILPYIKILHASGRFAPSALDRVMRLSTVSVSTLEYVVQEHIPEVTAYDIWQTVAQALGKPYRDLISYTPSSQLLAMVPSQLSQLYGVLPLSYEDGILEVALRDPCDFETLASVEFALHLPLQIVVAPSSRVASYITKYYGELGDSRMQSESDLVGEEPSVEETPVSDYVDQVLHQAVSEGASDIHFEPFEEEFKIRYRVDGELIELPSPPLRLTQAMTSRLKVLAQMNIAETRVPQDGRIQMQVLENSIELRVSSLPTQNGESIVCRILDRTTITLDLDGLGLSSSLQQRVQELIKCPNGVFLVTGPTGAGKTTTLYAALRELNTTDTKILTAEDPIEYDIEGVMQVAIHEKIGLTFDKVLRSLLRQDPDILLVGEIRDPETAQMTIQSALTGHFVLSTLHTNDAAGAITRLIDMGVEPFLITSALQGVLAQRLVRRLCAVCREPYTPSPSIVSQLGIAVLEVPVFYRASGCVECDYTGYNGRQGIFELLTIDTAMHPSIIDKAPSIELKKHALASGMRTLRQDALHHLYAGVTTVEEVLKYT